MIRFSIVIPLYNKSAYITKTLNSIKNQNYQDYEVVIVNDGSTDNSIEIVEDFIEKLNLEIKSKFKLFNKDNSGVSSTRNYGVKHSSYDYIVFLDADDYWENSHLSNFVNLINKYSDKVDMFSNASKQLQNGKFIFPKLSNYERVNYALRGMAIPAGKHTIEFKFEPQVVKTGSMISLLSFIGILLLLGGGIYYEAKKTKTV